MAQRSVWLLALATATVAGFAAVAWTEETRKESAEKAMEVADPDQVNPIDIKGEKYTFDFRFDTIEPLVVTNPEARKKSTGTSSTPSPTPAVRNTISSRPSRFTATRRASGGPASIPTSSPPSRNAERSASSKMPSR